MPPRLTGVESGYLPRAPVMERPGHRYRSFQTLRAYIVIAEPASIIIRRAAKQVVKN
jgi:hypothetical protein